MPLTIHDPRIGLEHALLCHFFGTARWFEWEGALCAEIGLLTNSKTLYGIRFVLPIFYPDAMPEVLVTHPAPLCDNSFRSLAERGPDAAMHVLAGRGPFTSICHYHPARWAADMTLYKAAIKARVWLETYEIHRRTGRPIATYLAHMKESP